MEEMTPTQPEPAVHGVTMRLPIFRPERPAVWFPQVEAQFELSSVTRQKTNFNYVVAQLNQQQAAEFEDIIIAPPEQDPYDQLKAELIRRLSTSPEQRVRLLLSREELGDRKPSQFLRHLKSLAPDVPADFLSIIWANRLPPHVQAILSGRPDDKLESAALLADKICEVPLPRAAAGVSANLPDDRLPQNNPVANSPYRVTTGQPQRLRDHARPKDRHQAPSRGQTHDADRSQASQEICWYHWHFVNQARECSPPCCHQQKGQQTNFSSYRSGNSPGRRQWRPTPASQVPAASSSQTESLSCNI